jgi:enoyl-CoA hydratase/carnithine racemase
MDYKVFLVEKDGHICKVIMNRPEKGNAMGPDFWDELAQIFQELNKDDETRAVVLMANGKNFSSGIDLLASVNLIPQGGEGPDIELSSCHEFLVEIQEKFNAIDRCIKPVIAAVHGACIGAGLDLITTCDIRLAAKDAYFSLKEVRIGMVADLGSLQRLPGIIGDGKVRELAYTARNFDADDAKDMGLLNAIYPDRDSCIKAALQLAEEIAANAPLAVQATKRTLNYSRDKNIDAGLEYAAAKNAQLIRSADVKEAFVSMAQNRKPDFKGE